MKNKPNKRGLRNLDRIIALMNSEGDFSPGFNVNSVNFYFYGRSAPFCPKIKAEEDYRREMPYGNTIHKFANTLLEGNQNIFKDYLRGVEIMHQLNKRNIINEPNKIEYKHLDIALTAMKPFINLIRLVDAGVNDMQLLSQPMNEWQEKSQALFAINNDYYDVHLLGLIDELDEYLCGILKESVRHSINMEIFLEESS